jgi:hypothetical protein
MLLAYYTAAQTGLVPAYHAITSITHTHTHKPNCLPSVVACAAGLGATLCARLVAVQCCA